MSVTILGYWRDVPASVGRHARSVLITPSAPILTLTQGKLRAGLDWADGDPRDALMTGFIAAAQQKLETDTGLALLTQVRDLYYDAQLPPILQLPDQALPLQSVASVKAIDTAGVTQTVNAAGYLVDLASARIGLAQGAWWPTDLRPFQPYVIRITAGYAAVGDVPPLLMHAVGLLTAHYATQGRDLTTAGTIITTTPMGYEDAIAPFCRVAAP